MRKGRLIGIVNLLLILYFSTFVFADTVILKSGEKVEGKILERTDKYIKIDFYGVTLTYYFDEIERIEGDKSIKQEGMGLYNPEQIKSIIVDYYNAFDNKNFLKWKTFLSKNVLSSGDGKYFIEEGNKIFSENLYIKTQFDLDKVNFEIKEDALWVSFWQFRTYISQKGFITTTENKVILIFKKEDNEWKVEQELQFLEKDNLALRQADGLLAEMRINDAIEKYKEVITMNPNLSSIYLGLMYAYSIENKIDEALIAIQKAVYLRPDIAAYHYLLGGFYAEKNQLEKTKEEYSKVIELDQKFPGVTEALQRLN